MKINCLSCGHNVDLDDAYTDNYEGAIKCYGCDATLEIKTEQGSLRGVHLCVPGERLERAFDIDPSDNHRGSPEHNGRPLGHLDKNQ
jgi:hypothetical protein